VDDDEILVLKSMNDEKKTQEDVQDLDNVYHHVENFLNVACVRRVATTQL
jgi:hypothetical protein